MLKIRKHNHYINEEYCVVHGVATVLVLKDYKFMDWEPLIGDVSATRVGEHHNSGD